MPRIEKVKCADDLPADWDNYCTNRFQRRDFLRHTEYYNPCSQRYYTVFENGNLVSGASVYTLTIDVLTFLQIKSPLPMHIVGIPCSVSCPGVIGDPAFHSDLFTWLTVTEKGFLLVLNLEESCKSELFTTGNTLPTVILDCLPDSWESYTASLRYPYRRRLHKIERCNGSVTLSSSSCTSFSEEMLQQYHAVFRRSNAKLESLNKDFFVNLPGDFRLVTLRAGSRLIGWYITVAHRNCYYFFLGGVDYRFNRHYATYLRILVNIIREGIERKMQRIDLGQTAEIPKLRFGGALCYRYMAGRHSNGILNHCIGWGRRFLVYRKSFPAFHVFRERSRILNEKDLMKSKN